MSDLDGHSFHPLALQAAPVVTYATTHSLQGVMSARESRMEYAPLPAHGHAFDQLIRVIALPSPSR